MQNKLQELTEKLYTEGLSKGKLEAEEMKNNAKKEAAEIISLAKEESKLIIAKAHKEAEDIQEKILNEVKMASKQSISALKNQIETIIVNNVIAEPTQKAMSSTDLVKSIIQSAISAFNPNSTNNSDLSILLPESMKNELDSFMKNEIKNQFKTEIEVKFDKKLNSGFKIGPKGESYYVSFTDKDFQELLASYLRPKTREFLFSE